MSWLTRLISFEFSKVTGRKFARSLQRNQRAMDELDAALREVLGL